MSHDGNRQGQYVPPPHEAQPHLQQSSNAAHSYAASTDQISSSQAYPPVYTQTPPSSYSQQPLAPHPSAHVENTNSSSSQQQPLQANSSRNFQAQAEPNLVFRIGKFIPCLFIAAVIGWSYYAVIFHIILHFYQRVVQNIPLFVYLIIQYHVILLLFVWSWLKTVLTKPMTVGDKYRLTQEEVHSVQHCRTITQRNQYFETIVAARKLVVVQRLDKSHPNDFRYCKKSQALKPDRAHYDSMTKRLVLKMDHYCPWVANCIGYSNYKFFVLFLFYAIMYCWMIIAIAIRPFLEVWTKTGRDINTDTSPTEPSGYRMQVILVFLVSAVFSLSVLFLFGFHCYLISRNRTTIECYGAPVIRNVGECKHAYDVGCMPNWRQVMGRSVLCWLLPISYDDPRLDGGHRYPLSPLLATNQAIDEV